VTEEGALAASEIKEILISKILNVKKTSDGIAVYTVEENNGRVREETTENLLLKCPRLLINFL
jgi:hypothetical protein